MKRILILAAVAGALFMSGTSRAGEVGAFVGGGFNLKDSLDTFSVGPVFSGTETKNEAPLHGFFLVPIFFDTEAGADVFGVSLIPGVEYDIPVWADKLFVSPTLGLQLGWQQSKFSGATVHSFLVGVMPTVQVKYAVLENLIVRFSPVAINMLFWSYSTQGIGSETNFSASYQLMGGVSYLF